MQWTPPKPLYLKLAIKQTHIILSDHESEHALCLWVKSFHMEPRPKSTHSSSQGHIFFPDRQMTINTFFRDISRQNATWVKSTVGLPLWSGPIRWLCGGRSKWAVLKGNIVDSAGPSCAPRCYFSGRRVWGVWGIWGDAMWAMWATCLQRRVLSSAIFAPSWNISTLRG